MVSKWLQGNTEGTRSESVDSKKKMANALLFKRFLFAADRIHYLTEKEKERSAFDLPCFIAPNGTDARFEKRRFSETGCLVSYIGRLDVEIKGIDLLLDALHLVRDELVNLGFSMSMYGPGDHEGILDMVRERGLGGVVRVYGPIFGDAKKDVLSSSDLFIQASRSEGLPMGLIEAMATGLPCLVTEGTGMGSLLVDHDAGWCCETASDAIAEALLVLCVVVSVAFCFEFTIFHRFTTYLAPILAMPLFMRVFQEAEGGKPGVGGLPYRTRILLVMVAMLLLACARGSLCGLKFFVL